MLVTREAKICHILMIQQFAFKAKITPLNTKVGDLLLHKISINYPNVYYIGKGGSISRSYVSKSLTNYMLTVTGFILA